MNGLTKEAAGYVAVSAVAFLLDIGLLALQVSVLGIPYLAAAAIAFLAGTVFVYWASVRHIFEFRRLDNAHMEFSFFLAVGVIGLGVNLAAMYAFVDGLGLHYLLAKICAAALTFGVNFGLRRLLLFTRWRDRTTRTAVKELTR